MKAPVIVATALALGALLLTASPALAQDPADTLPRVVGERVRVHDEAGVVHQGTALAFTSRLVRLSSNDPARGVIELNGWQRLEIYRGQRRRIARGAGYGLLGGMVTGALIGALDDSCDFLACGRGERAMWGAIGLGLGGLVFGMLVGASSPVDIWEDVGPPSDVRVSIADGGDGVFQLAFRVQF